MVDAAAADGLVTALHRATHATLNGLASRLARLGMGSAELNVLAVLADGRERTVGALAAATATKPGSLTSVLDRLAGKGHIVRELDPADRRSFVISLTPAGRRAAAAVHAEVAEFERAVRARVSPADMAGFHAVAKALVEVSR